MKLSKLILLLAAGFAFSRSTAQDPYFVQKIHTGKSDVCRGENVSLSARVANTNYYEFQLLEPASGEWIRLSSGHTDTTAADIGHLFSSVSSSLTVRVFLKNRHSEIAGDALEVRVHHPVFDIQPKDLTQCNGGEVIFMTSVSGAQSYQWESSTDGLAFSPLSATTKFREVNTPHLRVTDIVNNHHGLVFRCRVKDAFQCEAFSDPAVLSVNQLSTAVSPTTSTAFCEGDTARFFPSVMTGTAVSFQWFLRKTGQTTYAPLEENEKFTGTAEQSLRVKGIRPSENSYRLRAGFTALTQNQSGEIAGTVCFLESTRANYTIHPRPAPPALPHSPQSCGPASFLLSGTEAGYWYEDTLASPVKQNALFYQTPELTSSRVYYYSVKDARSCESYRQAIKVAVHPVPAQVFSLSDGVCPGETRVPLTITDAAHTPLYLFVSSPDLSGFIPVDSLAAASPAGIELPLNKNTGSYTLLVHSKNEHCSSDTTRLLLNVFRNTRIHPSVQDVRVCETEKILLQAHFEAEGPANIAWYHEGTELIEVGTDSLLIPSASRSHEGEYQVKVSGKCGEEISDPFTLRILPATSILIQPENIEICEKANATFRIRATGSGPLNYQWFINEQAMPGNADSLVIPQAGKALNGAQVTCKINSRCLKELFSDTVLLIVRPLPPPPRISDTLTFCTSSSVINLAQGDSIPALHWYDSSQQRLPSPEVNASVLGNQPFFVSETDSYGCESPLKPFMALVYPSFTLTAVSESAQLCLTGHFNRDTRLATFTNSPKPVSFQLIYQDQVVETNLTGNFSVHQPGTYVIHGRQEHCSATDSIRISPAGIDLSHPPAVSDAEACFGGSALLEAVSEYSGGRCYWWETREGTSGFTTGPEILIPGIISDTAFFVSYGRLYDHFFCESPRSKAEVRILNPLGLGAGQIAENNSVNCAGYNPPQINSLEAPAKEAKIQWQSADNCENPLWQDIPGATGLTYNPPVLLTTTCFRRKAYSNCDTVFSNITLVRIVPDPSLTISANHNKVYPEDSLILRATVRDGAGNCPISWQVNRVSAAASHAGWTHAGTGQTLHYPLPVSDNILHFRARVNCELSSCNLATSNIISISFHQRVSLRIHSQTQTMANCYGNVSYLQVQAEGEGILNYRWQRKRPEDSVFTDLRENNSLSGTQSPTLRMATTGNAESPHLSSFRCIITDTIGQIITEQIPLTVNRLVGNLSNQTLCTGNDLHLDLNVSHSLTGHPLQFEWQHRTGTGHPWASLKDTGQVSGSASPYLKIISLPEQPQTQFRCAVTFSSHNGSCVQTTNLMTLKTGSYPEKPADIGVEICQNQNPEKIMIYPPENLQVAWYHLYETTTLTRQPEITTDIPGDFFLQYTYINDKKCESPRARVRITVHPAPPLPVNTTPEITDDTEPLIFSAEGENLKWYRTGTLRAFETYPPSFTSTGQKSYYVTQTDFRGCESERQLIRAEIRPAFRITAEPRDQYNCAGNTVTFSVRIAGGGADVSYQWQREHAGEFHDIPGAILRDLRLPDIGTGDDTDGTRYRCLIRSAENQLVSPSAVLHINLLKPALPRIDLCPGEKIDFSRYRDSIKGVIEKVEWQKRTGNTYNTVFESATLSEIYTPDTSAGSYRLRVTFRSSGGSCVRNSNAIPLIIHSLPDLSLIDSVKICEGLTVASLLKHLPPNVMVLNSDSSETDISHLLQQGDQFRVVATGTAGCISSFRNYSPQILPRPLLNPVDTLIRICRFSPPVKGSTLKEKNWWKLPGKEWGAELEISTSEEGEYRVAYKTRGDNGCFSDAEKMTFQIASCYFSGQIDTCADFPAPALQAGEWNYFYRENGEILAAVHPQGVNTGSINLVISTTKRSSVEDLSGNRFYPRSLSLNTARSLPSKVKLRFYMSLKEIAGYRKELNDTTLLIYREEALLECHQKPGNTILWLKDTIGWKSTEHVNYKYFEFETEATGRYFIKAEPRKTSTPAGECVLIENPLSNEQSIRLLFPDLQKSRTRLVTLQGQEIPLLRITEKGDQFRITPIRALAKGTYYLKTENRLGIPCTKRIIIY